MENDIITSWNKNAREWINLMDNSEIESRKFTNRAILELLNNLSVSKILDVGCGEGWLTRSLIQNGKKAIGLDATNELLVNARKKGPGTYYQLTYKEIIDGKSIPETPYDAAVFNFCLYQKEGLSTLLQQVKNSLSNNGQIVIQTLHPFFLKENDLEYKSQWIPDSWKGLPGNFTQGHSWYARTLQDWMHVFKQSKLQLESIHEVINNDNNPVSIIFVIR
ncbi:class I SAM-dependent methyltransferase [Arenibacter amylolyticus]|uniref:class I SAM-dependent methyltransferase n=1 Tax=Arenibacter amylolyticus TaxID=1406873 RepID=UPI000A37CC96|nr:methyltransferase domain-containing protein [Arenibacter amylolyticus]